MRDNWDTVFGIVLGHEGGFQADPKDRGNWTGGKVGAGVNKGTKYGISAMSYPSLDIARLTEQQAKAIYRRDFWDRIRGDDLPGGLDLVTFDAAVNSGRNRAVKWLQAALRGPRIDGLMGPATLAACEASDVWATVEAACDHRLDYLEDLPMAPRYGKGWKRRVEEIRHQALKLVNKPIPEPRLPEATMPSQFFPELDADRKPDKPFPGPAVPPRVPRVEQALTDSQEPPEPVVEKEVIDSGLAVDSLGTPPEQDIVTYITLKLVNGRVVSCNQTPG